jgi:tetratricopeptide (TPR) repeat protein
MQEWRLAKELDPLSLIIGSAFGYYLVWQGRKQEGLSMLQSVVEINDEFVVGHQNLAFAYVLAGMNSEATAEAKKMIRLSTETRHTSFAACAFARAGQREDAVTILNGLLKERDERYTDPASIAMIYASLEDRKNALQWLDKAVSEKSAGILYTRIFPVFEFLRDNPRFREISKKIGLG